MSNDNLAIYTGYQYRAQNHAGRQTGVDICIHVFMGLFVWLCVHEYVSLRVHHSEPTKPPSPLLPCPELQNSNRDNVPLSYITPDSMNKGPRQNNWTTHRKRERMDSVFEGRTEGGRHIPRFVLNRNKTGSVQLAPYGTIPVIAISPLWQNHPTLCSVFCLSCEHFTLTVLSQLPCSISYSLALFITHSLSLALFITHSLSLSS